MTKQQIIEKYRQNIVFIGLKNLQKMEPLEIKIIGTGFVVEGRYVVTCAHIYDKVIENNDSEIFAGILSRPGSHIDEYQTAELFYIDRDDERDICILGLKEPRDFGFDMDDILTDEQGLQAGVEALQLGFPIFDEIIVPGASPAIFAEFCTVGSVFYNREGAIDHIQIASTRTSVCEGSPLIDISSEKIIGVICGSYADVLKNIPHSVIPSNISVARPSLALYELLDNPECKIFSHHSFFEDLDEEL